MKNYLQRNYWETKAKYEKFRRRLDRKIKNGSFNQLSVKKQRLLVDRVKRLFEKLKELQMALKLGAAGATMALALSIGNLNAQELSRNEKHPKLFAGKHQKGMINHSPKGIKDGMFVQVRGSENPFGGSNPFDGLITYSGWADFADLDGDGDLDVIVGADSYDPVSYDANGFIVYYKNTGTTELVELELQEGANNPFDGLEFDEDPGIRLVDIDSDGDLDLFAYDEIETQYNWYYGFRFFENTGSASSPSFVEQTGADNPLEGEEFDYPYGFSFVDIDGDNDLDMFIGEEYLVDYNWQYKIRYYKNTGTSTDPVFQVQTGGDNPLDDVSTDEYNFIPAFADMDNDGDYDAIIGTNDGFSLYFKNNGSASTPDFDEQVGSGNPFDQIWVGWRFNADLVDYDDDGDLDALIHNGDGFVKYIENTGSAASPDMTDQSGVIAGYLAYPEFADLDGDGDLDLIVGSYDAYIDGEQKAILYYKNTGTASSAVFEMQSDSNDPFDGMDFGYFAKPALVDIDNDGDIDLFSATYDGYASAIDFYKNTGSATNPQFDKQTGADNPMDGISGSDYMMINLVDIDGDGDYDLFVGDYIETKDAKDYGFLKYYRNTGTAESPVFEEATSPISDTFESTYWLKPEFADVDNDGDYDCMVGTYYDDGEDGARMYYFKNNGTATEPDFELQTGIDDPLENEFIGLYIALPAFADLDADGDQDVAIGTYGGSILYFKNTTDPVSVNKVDLANNVEIYPNPSSGILKIDMQSDSNQDVNIELYDYLGKQIEVYRFESIRISLDISHLSPGMYFVKIKQGERLSTAKIIKE